MRIGELARRTAVSERSLRYYEKQGMLSSERTPGGHRDYPERAVDRVVLIQQLFAAGLPSTKIAQMLPCMRDPDGGPNELATPALIGELAAERDRINAMIGDLLRSREVLNEVINTASTQLKQPATPAGTNDTGTALRTSSTAAANR
jgi:DNA-binding transcriptional MerR regulator